MNATQKILDAKRTEQKHSYGNVVRDCGNICTAIFSVDIAL